MEEGRWEVGKGCKFWIVVVVVKVGFCEEREGRLGIWLWSRGRWIAGGGSGVAVVVQAVKAVVFLLNEYKKNMI